MSTDELDPADARLIADVIAAGSDVDARVPSASRVRFRVSPASFAVRSSGDSNRAEDQQASGRIAATVVPLAIAIRWNLSRPSRECHRFDKPLAVWKRRLDRAGSRGVID